MDRGQQVMVIPLATKAMSQDAFKGTRHSYVGEPMIVSEDAWFSVFLAAFIPHPFEALLSF